MDQLEGLSGALFSYDQLRSELADQSANEWRPRRARDEVISARELAMLAELNGIHDAMSDVDQLRLYRFFLVAVHHNSLQMHRFDAQIIAYPERVAAIERELDDVSADLAQLITETAEFSALIDLSEARLQAATFLWTSAWWLHSRPDVEDFKFPSGDDVLSSLLLGREPNSDEPVTDQMYRSAMKAEHEYRKMLMRKVPKNLIAMTSSGDFKRSHVPLHMRAESHM